MHTRLAEDLVLRGVAEGVFERQRGENFKCHLIPRVHSPCVCLSVCVYVCVCVCVLVGRRSRPLPLREQERITTLTKTSEGVFARPKSVCTIAAACESLS